MRIIDENSPSLQFLWDAKLQISHEFEAKYKKILGNWLLLSTNVYDYNRPLLSILRQKMTQSDV
jgi:hypothetical protein